MKTSFADPVAKKSKTIAACLKKLPTRRQIENVRFEKKTVHATLIRTLETVGHGVFVISTLYGTKTVQKYFTPVAMFREQCFMHDLRRQALAVRLLSGRFAPALYIVTSSYKGEIVELLLQRNIGNRKAAAQHIGK
ncbi:hypothetical protein Tcan_13648 [Toxocara canis]|uniref:Uncharacterized protein n=1 Tax=Toxocara canis TaxID=6265 RepID=A0A0B2VJX2_TOXCA|nr:hypothetical protein Tcan_13648 [Toxocara canis]